MAFNLKNAMLFNFAIWFLVVVFIAVLGGCNG